MKEFLIFKKLSGGLDLKLNAWLKVETIDNSVFATRTSTKNADADYEIVTVCDRVVPAINVKSRIYKRDGIWIEDITAN